MITGDLFNPRLFPPSPLFCISWLKNNIQSLSPPPFYCEFYISLFCLFYVSFCVIFSLPLSVFHLSLLLSSLVCFCLFHLSLTLLVLSLPLSFLLFSFLASVYYAFLSLHLLSPSLCILHTPPFSTFSIVSLCL